jgi:DNA modification methylase
MLKPTPILTSLPKPFFYQDPSVVIIHGDCREILPGLSPRQFWPDAGEKFDLLLTDPPYGIDAAANKRANQQHGKATAPSKDYGASDWDKFPADLELLNLCRNAGDFQIIWGGNYFPLPPRRGWLIWDKDNGNNGYADCELAWSNLETAVRKIKYRWAGMLQQQMGADKEQRFHPTQKPVPVMAWCINHAESAQTILDPFAGSCTTARAAKDLGRRCVCIEREEKYCEIGARRMQQEVLSLQALD